MRLWMVAMTALLLGACGPAGMIDEACTSGACAQACSDCDRACTGGACTQTCEGGACDLSCTGGGCTQTCEAGSTCDASCTGSGCTQVCEDGATCDFSCIGQCEVSGLPTGNNPPDQNNPPDNPPGGVTSCTDLCDLTPVATAQQGDCVGTAMTVRGYPILQTPACLGFTTVTGCQRCYQEIDAKDPDCVASHAACF